MISIVFKDFRRKYFNLKSMLILIFNEAIKITITEPNFTAVIVITRLVTYFWLFHDQIAQQIADQERLGARSFRLHLNHRQLSQIIRLIPVHELRFLNDYSFMSAIKTNRCKSDF